MAIEYWRDFDINFEKAASGDIRVMRNFDAIENSLRNIFETLQGQRRMLPDFAVGMAKLLFEPVDAYTAGIIAELIYDAIEKWESRIQIEGLDILADSENNRYTITLNYRILEDQSGESSREFGTILRAS